MFNHVAGIELPNLVHRMVGKTRYYITPEGNEYPSITTILSVKNKTGLVEWRKRGGDEVANYVLVRPLLGELRYTICVKITLTT